MLVLYGCKRHLLDPLNPQTQLPPKVQLDKVKGFYENGRYKNQPKRSSPNGNERMTSQDSARFKDFEPQWDKTQVELLPNNEKMLIVPVVRFLRVDYNENIGFIRRLCIRVDANDDFLEANIVELVGNLNFVKENHNAIFKNYKENNITGFSGVVATYGLNYDKISTKEFNNGIGNTCANCLIVLVVGDCIIITDNGGNVILEVCGDGGSGVGGNGGGNGDAPNCTCIRCSRPPGGIPNPSGPITIPNVPIITPNNTPQTPQTPPYVNPTYTPPGPIYTPIYDPSGTGTDTGSGGTYNPPPIPPKGYQIPVVVPTVVTPTTTVIQPSTTLPPMPFPGMVLGDDLVWYFPDNGVSWGNDWGDGVPRDADGNELDADGNLVQLPLPNNVVIDDVSWDRSTYGVKFKCILNKLLKNPIVQRHLHAHYTPANPLRIKFEQISGTRSMFANANFDEMNNTITVNSDKYNIFNDAPDAYLATTVFHEIIHSFIDGVIKDYAIANPTLNFERDGANSSNPDVKMIHDYYYGAGKNYYIPGDANQAQHNLMAEKYLTTIAKFACSIAGVPITAKNINTLLPLAWKGLSINEPGVQIVKTWADMPDAEKNIMKKKMESINKNTLLTNPNFKCNN